MRIAIDAMGSDALATPLVEGAVKAAERYDAEFLLVGKQYSLRRLLRHFGYAGDRIRIIPASQIVDMEENPRNSLRKKDSSIAVATRLVADGQADALVSAGNTGATKAHTLMAWRRLEGIGREGIATVIPTRKEVALLVDAGASVDCKPQNLLDFATMGSVYSRDILGRQNPRVGLLSVGSEPGKGNQVVRTTYKLLEASHLNFVGNVEPSDMLEGRTDVVVCDGFVGNVLLKASEAVAKFLMSGVKGAMTRNVISLAGALMVAPGMRKLKRRVDYSEYGGAPLLGLNGVCIIAHGSSSPKAIMNAIRVAIEAVDHRVQEHIQQEVQRTAREIEEAGVSTEPEKVPDLV